MILLDTNVVSEAMKPEPSPPVRAWLNKQPARALYLSSVTFAELWFGVAVMPDGRRKLLLAEALDQTLHLFEQRILPFDTDAASQYSELAVMARRSGLGFPLPDGYIAAIAVACGCAVASRDTGPFEAARVPVINPWKDR
jgi:hypothetical protein